LAGKYAGPAPRSEGMLGGIDGLLEFFGCGLRNS